MSGRRTCAAFCCDFICTVSNAVADFEGAVRIYRRCRQAGITPRGLVDCMIAAVARRHQAMLLTCDADLNRVARVIGIELDQPQPEPPQPT